MAKFNHCIGNAGGGDGNIEDGIQSPVHQVEATLLGDVWIRQEYDCDHFGARHPPLHAGILGADALDQCAAATVGGWRRAKPIQVSTPGITLPTHPLRHPNPMHTPAHHHQPP